jgi:hypothetical protein
VVELVGDAASLEKSLGSAEKATGRFGGGMQRVSHVAGIAGLAIGGALVAGLGESVKAALAGQASQAALEQALKRTGQSASAQAPALESAEAASRKLGFANEDTRAALARLELATKSTKQSVSELAVAEDISRLKHLDLASATNMLTQAQTGSQRAAKQLGIVIPAVTTHLDALKASGADLTTVTGKLEVAHAKLADKMATGQAVIAAVTDRVKGQASAFADTAAGGMAQFHAQTGALMESLGTMLLPAITAVSEKLSALTGWLSQHTTVAKIAVGVLGGLAVVLLTVSVAETIVSAATSAWTAAQWLLNTALAANPIGLVIVAIAGLAAGIAIAWQHSETFRAIVTAAFDAVKQAGDRIVHMAEEVWHAFETALNWTRANWPLIATIIAGPFAPLVAVASNAFGVRSALIGAFDDIRDAAAGAMNAVARIVHAVASAISGAVGAIVGEFESIINVLQDIIGVAETAANAIAKVAGAGHAIGSAVGAVGSAASTVGSALTHPFGLGRAAGGSITAGQTYLVGERGPELFTSATAGAIIPNGGFGGVTVNVTVPGTLVGSNGMAEFAQILRTELLRIGQRNGTVLGGLA